MAKRELGAWRSPKGVRWGARAVPLATGPVRSGYRVGTRLRKAMPHDACALAGRARQVAGKGTPPLARPGVGPADGAVCQPISTAQRVRMHLAGSTAPGPRHAKQERAKRGAAVACASLHAAAPSRPPGARTPGLPAKIDEAVVAGAPARRPRGRGNRPIKSFTLSRAAAAQTTCTWFCSTPAAASHAGSSTGSPMAVPPSFQ